MSRLWLSFPAAQLGENLLHLSEDVSERWGLLDPHPIGSKAEAEPPGTVERVLSIPVEAIVEKSIFLIIIVVVIVGHRIEKRVSVT